MFDMLYNMRTVADSVYAHSLNVALISRMIGRWLRFERHDLDILTLAGLMHDIGKLLIPSDILNKPGSLTDEEFAKIKQHPALGYEILKRQPDLDSRIKKAALMHHERCDGSGYPTGLTEDYIDNFAMIVAIADVYDAMTAARSYRSPLCPFEVISKFEEDGFQKYHTKYILVFLKQIASTYQSNRVILSDGRGCTIVMLELRSRMETIIAVFSVELLQSVYHITLLIGYRIAITGQNHTDCSIVFKLQIDLIQSTVHTSLHDLDNIVLHAGQYHLCLRVTESCIVLQYFGAVRCQHQSEENNAFERSAFRCHGIHRSLVNIFLAECIHFFGIERAGRKGSHTAGIQSLIAILRSLVILCRSHDPDGLAIYKGKYTDFSSGHKLFDDHTITSRTEFLVCKAIRN